MNSYKQNSTLQQLPSSPFEKAPVGLTSNEEKYSLYIVDDSPMMLRVVKKAFEPYEGYHLSYFESGEECVAAMGTPPDMMILDFHLTLDESDTTIMNGLDVLQKVKEISPDTKVVILSSQNDVSVAVKCLKLGAIDYVIKDEVMNVNITKAIEKIAKSIELKQEIQSLSQTIKRDKLMMKGYFVFTIALICTVLFLLLK